MDDSIHPDDAPLSERHVDISKPFSVAKKDVIDKFEKGYLNNLLNAAKGNISKAARLAGTDRMYVHRLIRKHKMARTGYVRPLATPRCAMIEEDVLSLFKENNHE